MFQRKAVRGRIFILSYAISTELRKQAMKHSTHSFDSDARMQKLVELLLQAEPVLRSRLQARRIRSDRVWDTSDAFASVIRRSLAVERRRGIRALGKTDPTHLLAFLDKVLNSVVADQWRRLFRSTRIHAIAVDRERAVGNAIPRDDSLAKGELTKTIVAAISKCDETEFALIQLRLRGTPWDEIAKGVGLSSTACRQKWSRFLENIRRQLRVE